MTDTELKLIDSLAQKHTQTSSRRRSARERLRIDPLTVNRCELELTQALACLFRVCVLVAHVHVRVLASVHVCVHVSRRTWRRVVVTFALTLVFEFSVAVQAAQKTATASNTRKAIARRI